MGYHTYESYAIYGDVLNGAPNDSSTYLIGVGGLLTTGGALARMHVPRAGTIRNVKVAWYNNTQDCTAENTSFYIRKNETTDGAALYTGSFANAASPQIVSNVNMSVDANDFIHLKMVTPAWVTNPTGVYLQVVIEVQC